MLKIELLRRTQMRRGACERHCEPGISNSFHPFVIKENEQNVRLSDSTVTVDCRDPVLLACCQCSPAHMTETLIKCQAYKAAIKRGFYGEGEIRKESLTVCD